WCYIPFNKRERQTREVLFYESEVRSQWLLVLLLLRLYGLKVRVLFAANEIPKFEFGMGVFGTSAVKTLHRGRPFLFELPAEPGIETEEREYDYHHQQQDQAGKSKRSGKLD
ncbi:hypothetical protein, partial [Stomatobaculum longum]|uniref:hypothetical protein n=1 Tax=Stomatobaculum longum TaxID=796942 RepID=UPI0028E9E9F9